MVKTLAVAARYLRTATGADVNGYPQRYPPSLHLQVRAVTADGIGSEVELRPRGGRAFRCRVESLEAPRRLRRSRPRACTTTNSGRT